MAVSADHFTAAMRNPGIMIEQRSDRRPPRHREPKRGGTAKLVTGALILAIVSGGVGGGVAIGLEPRIDTAGTHVSSPVQAAVNRFLPSVEPVAAKVLPSVVELRIGDGDNGRLGAGIILTSDGLILTNSHVVSAQNTSAAQGAPHTQAILADGRTVPFTVVGGESATDIAVVRAQGVAGLTPIAFGTSADLRVGQQVVAVGSPLGLTATVTSGIISALNRQISPQGRAPQRVLTPFKPTRPSTQGIQVGRWLT
jgi:putative serine protease PepD